MKAYKLAAAAALSAAALVASASADVTIHIVGSTAYRANTCQAIANTLTGGYTFGYDNAQGPGFSAHSIFVGTITAQPGLGTVTVKTSWSGSANGIQAVEQPVAQLFLNNPGTLTSGGVTLAAPTSGTGETIAPEITMADVYQITTPFNATHLVDNVVGVVPFAFVASNASHGITNITPQLAQYQFTGNGVIPLAMYSGLNSDEGTLVYATGRDPDSGTRLTAFAETGVTATGSAVAQYKPTASGTALTATWNLYAQETVNGIVVPAGQGGESSGGTVAKNMRYSGSDANGYMVSYLGTNDLAATALSTSTTPPYSAVNAGPAVQLKYNGFLLTTGAVDSRGVAAITNPNIIEEGQYTFWGYEHLDYKSTLHTTNANAFTYAGLLVTQISTTDAIITTAGTNANGTGSGQMNVQRPSDGGLVTDNYF